MNDDEQAAFWRGSFGDEYATRNAATADALHARVALWSQVLGDSGPRLGSVLEVGSNVGTNLRALRALTSAELYAVEPNDAARQRMLADGIIPPERVSDATAAKLPFADGEFDLVFTSGVLIHIHPDNLLQSCKEIFRVSRRYIASIEYFSDKEEEVSYRGHSAKLFKRDFGGFWLDNFTDLKLISYGFSWKRVTGLDNLTWWLFEKDRPIGRA